MSVALSFAGLIDDLGHCGQPEDAWQLGREWLNDNGVAWCNYAHVAGYREAHERRLIRYSSLPEAWLEHYDAESFFSLIRRYTTACKKLLRWSQDIRSGRPTAARQRGSAMMRTRLATVAA